MASIESCSLKTKLINILYIRIFKYTYSAGLPTQDQTSQTTCQSKSFRSVPVHHVLYLHLVVRSSLATQRRVDSEHYMQQMQPGKIKTTR